MRRIKSSRSNKGFTLIETIIALGIFTIVIAATYSLILSGMSVYAMNSRAVQGQSAMRLSLMRITQDIRSIEGNNSYDIILFSKDLSNNTKTLSIGTNIQYQFDGNLGTIKRTQKITSPSGTTTTLANMLAEGVVDFTITKNTVTKNEISVIIQGINVSEKVESKITFRDVV